MDFSKILTLLAGVVMACDYTQAHPLTAAQEVTEPTVVLHGWDQIIDYYVHPRYQFNYAVHDPDTGDVKNQWEARDGDVVKGSYTVHDPDGTIRTVDYTSDKYSGFNAVVKKVGKAYHPKTVIAKKYKGLGGHSDMGGHAEALTEMGGHAEMGAEDTMGGHAEVELTESQTAEEQKPQPEVQTDHHNKDVHQMKHQEGESSSQQEVPKFQMMDEKPQKDDGSVYYLPLNFESQRFLAAIETNHY